MKEAQHPKKSDIDVRLAPKKSLESGPQNGVFRGGSGGRGGEDESERDALLRKRLLQKLKKPGRLARGAVPHLPPLSPAAGRGTAASTESVNESRKNLLLQKQKQKQQRRWRHRRQPPRSEINTAPTARDGDAVVVGVVPRCVDGDGAVETVGETDDGSSEITFVIPKDGEAVGMEKSIRDQSTSVPRDIAEQTDAVYENHKSGVTPMAAPPLNKRPPGGPFGSSNARAWNTQQMVQSAATPMQVKE